MSTSGIWSVTDRSMPVRISGPAGFNGRSLSYAGDYNGSVSYTATTETSAVVWYNGYWYYTKPQAGGIVSGQTPSATSSYWTRFTGSFQNVATNVLYANEGQLGDFRFYRESGQGIFESTDTSIRGVANIRLNSKTGQAEFNDVIVRGSIRSPFVDQGTMPSASITDRQDNIIVSGPASAGGSQIFSLVWNPTQSGRKVTLVHSRSSANFDAVINAPSGFYIYEFGRRNTSVRIRGEFIELVGIGTATTFYGWQVVSRKYLYGGLTGSPANYRTGRAPGVLAMGQVVGGKSSMEPYFIRSLAFDGTGQTGTGGTSTNMSVTRISEGLYRVYFPSAWVIGAGYYMVTVTGAGYTFEAGTSYNRSTYPAKATLISYSASYFDVMVSDDYTRNDGDFSFVMYSMCDITGWGGWD